MRTHRIFAGAAFAALALACATPERAPAPEGAPLLESQRVAAGREEYERYCMACHGVQADGNGPVAPFMVPRPTDLRTIAARRDGVFPHAAMTAMIDGRDPHPAHGTRDMPIWGDAFRTEAYLEQATETRVRGRVVLLVQYLESIQQPGRGAPVPHP
jgi:mono/diheme cytochrome c family protein